MIENWQMQSLSLPERFTAYAWAYLRAALRTCEDIKGNPSQYGFPDANVVLMLAAHSVELFLKGAILRRNDSFGIVSHRLADLHREFDRLYPDACYRWELPFGTEYVGFTEQEALVFQKTEAAPSIRYRYPANNLKQVWSGVHGFEPATFLDTLTQLNSDFVRIEKALSGG